MRAKRPQHATELRALPLFGRLTGRELAWVDQLVDRTDVRTGYCLIREGSVAHEAFVILEGEAEPEEGGSPELAGAEA